MVNLHLQQVKQSQFPDNSIFDYFIEERVIDFIIEIVIKFKKMESNQPTPKICSTCNTANNDLLKCTRCKKAYYCNVECQKADWPKHKLTCSKSSAVPNQPKEDLTGMNEFHKVQHIGTGNFTTIYRAVSKIDHQTYAIKQAEKAKLTRVRKEADLFMEKHCLGKLKDCEYVVKLHRTFQDELHLFLQMEYPEGGELWEQAKFYGIIGESLYNYYACHIIKAIHTIHEQYQIVHRDIKPENILLTKDHKIKFIDFGTAKDLQRPDLLGSGNGLKGRTPFYHYVGTPNYMAPECIHNKASEKISDVYSLSGLLYFLKIGSAPFAAASEYLIFTKSIEKQLTLPSQLFKPALADLIHKMNIKQMTERLPLNKILEHEYFKGVDFDHLPSYEQALEALTPFEKTVNEICKYLIEKYSNLHKELLEKRQEIYKQEIVPYLDQWLEKAPQNLQRQAQELIEIIKIQTEVMINLSDDMNIGFTELYKKMKGIVDPVVVKQLIEEEIEGAKLEKEINSLQIKEVDSTE